MQLHPLASNFAEVAGAYERGRPGYPPAAVGALAAELGLGPGAEVLDLAAGTGKLTRALLAAGYAVTALEPQAPLREMLCASVGAISAERVRAGVAEDIPLADGSVDAVTVADAFHWFDPGPALAEIRRVLRPGGGLAVLSTIHDWAGASWAHEVGNLIAGLRPSHPHFEGPSWRESVAADGGWTAPREVRVTASQPAEVERVGDYVSSISWVAALGQDERAQLIERVEELVGAGQTPAQWSVHTTIGLASRET